jgi:hypothetical protein
MRHARDEVEASMTEDTPTYPIIEVSYPRMIVFAALEHLVRIIELEQMNSATSRQKKLMKERRIRSRSR